MNKLLKLATSIAFGFTIIGCASNDTFAQSNPNVLVMVEDYDQDTIPRNSRVTRQVLQELQNEFNSEGYNMLDEQSLSRDYFVPGRTRRSREELLDIAQYADKPVDIVVVFHIIASTKDSAFMRTARMRVEGEMLDAHQHRTFGNFEVVSRDDFKLPVDCTRECMLEELSEEARILGRDLGDVLTDQIRQFWRPATASTGGQSNVASGGGGGSSSDAGFERVHSLCFDGFSQDEILVVEEYLVIFSGYIGHRPTDTRAKRSCFDYTSTIDPAKLNRNLVRMLDHSDLNGRVMARDDFDYEIVRIADRKRSPIESNDW